MPRGSHPAQQPPAAHEKRLCISPKSRREATTIRGQRCELAQPPAETLCTRRRCRSQVPGPRTRPWRRGASLTTAAALGDCGKVSAQAPGAGPGSPFSALSPQVATAFDPTCATVCKLPQRLRVFEEGKGDSEEEERGEWGIRLVTEDKS
ncbi:Helicase Arip4 [Manis pentadactyla]|nr:Helicase Arip4 [Manis pentadactyla]